MIKFTVDSSLINRCSSRILVYTFVYFNHEGMICTLYYSPLHKIYQISCEK